MISLQIDKSKIADARHYAKEIAQSLKGLLEESSSVTIERAIARLMGVDGATSSGVPYPNVIIEHLKEKGVLDRGVAYWLANGAVAKSMTVMELAEKVVAGELDLTAIERQPFEKIYEFLDSNTRSTLKKISDQRSYREEAFKKYGDRRWPAIYVIVATGNIYEDIKQAQAAAHQGADIIAVIRSTAQSLLDYVPYGATTSGFGGTYATQENFRLMRAALDETSDELKRYISLTNYASGLCMPEIAAMGALERLDVMLNDAMYGILFRDINMK
ncbi:MAG: lysine 5,6-aminomutase subunit alpha, partial [Candidatus Cloacimonas sp.]|nr:lysine 5,6-aminomutase subunit alpha [Candidatus Cloacimonadota bacterium]